MKACVLDRAPVAGLRLVSHGVTHDAGETRWIVLLDPVTSTPLAIVDETWNYAQRTVAAMALVARSLAASPKAVLGLVGAGRLAEAALTYYAHLFDLSEVRIASRREETRFRLAVKAEEALGLKAVAAPSVAEAVRGADQVLTCTSAGRPLLEGAEVAPGSVVAALDTIEPGPEFYWAADLVLVDSLEQLSEELVEVFGPEAPGRVDGEVAGVVAGRDPGRTSPDQRILVISQGLASLDVALAFRAYTLARENKRGRGLSLG